MLKQKQMTAVAIGCGVACALCVAAFMASVQGQADAARAEALARYGGEQVEVCVATRDITPGERVDLSAVETKLWVADLLPEGACRANGDVVGKIATSSILKGEVVTEKRFESTRDALDIPAGKDAVSVPAKAVQAVGGAIRPGMSVDVYAAGEATTEIAHAVPVVATSVGDSGGLISSDSGWITLAVEPEKVQEIIAASSKTTLYFVIPGEQVPSAESGDEGEGGYGEEEGRGIVITSHASRDSSPTAPPFDRPASSALSASPTSEGSEAAANNGSREGGDDR